MPAEETIWEMIVGGKYKDVMRLVKASIPHKDNLIKTIHKNGRNLPIHLIVFTQNKGDKPTDLLTLVLINSDAEDWGFQCRGTTAAKALLEAVSCDGDFRVIESLKEKEEFIVNNNQLTYDLALQKVSDKKTILESQRSNKEAQPDEVDSTLNSIEKWEYIASRIRDYTIAYAEKKLIIPATTAAEKNYYDELLSRLKCDQALARMRASTKALNKGFNNYSLLRAGVEGEVANIQTDHDLRELQIAEGALDGRQERLDAALAGVQQPSVPSVQVR